MSAPTERLTMSVADAVALYRRERARLARDDAELVRQAREEFDASQTQYAAMRKPKTTTTPPRGKKR